MKKTTKFLIFILLFGILFSPLLSLAADSGSLVPCGTERYAPGEKIKINGVDIDASGMVKNPCGFGDIMKMINKVIHFILFDMVVPIAAIMFAYAGFLLLTSGGETSKRQKAKKIFINVAIGFIIAVAAWLIVEFILKLLGYNTTWNWFGF